MNVPDTQNLVLKTRTLLQARLRTPFASQAIPNLQGCLLKDNALTVPQRSAKQNVVVCTLLRFYSTPILDKD